MIRTRNVWAILRKDILDGFRNYQVLLIVVTPILLSLIFSGIYTESRSKTILPKIGILGASDHPFLGRLSEKDFGVKISFFKSRTELEARLLEGDIGFGVILPALATASASASETPTLTLIHPTGLSEFMVERFKGVFEQEIRKFFHLPEPHLPIKVELSPVGGAKDGERSFSSDFFPMLILMAMGMVGFLGMPISLVEEKERRTLHALFLTPIRPNELIVGKSLFGLILIIFTVVTMVFINNKWLGDQVYFWLIVLMSSLFCLFLGLLISLLASSQASVNAFGTSLFMIFQLVPNLSQTSEVLRRFAWLVPSTYISRALKKALFLDLSKVDIRQDLAVIGGCALVTYLVVFGLLRWRQYKI